MSEQQQDGAAALGYASRQLTAQRLGFSPKRLDQLVAEGWVPKADRGRYDQLAAFQGVLRYQRDSARRANRSSADDELKRIRIRRERRKEMTEEGLMILEEDALFFIEELAGLMKLEVNNIPARFTRDLDVRERLQETVDEVLHAVADGVEKCCQALRTKLDAYPSGDQGAAEGDDTDD